MHTLKFKFEVYNSADIRLILKAAICPSLCHTEDVLTARVAVLLPVFAASFATSSCCTPYQVVLMSTAFWWAHPSENYCVHMLCTVQRVWPTYSPFQRLHLTLMISKNRLLYSVGQNLSTVYFLDILDSFSPTAQWSWTTYWRTYLKIILWILLVFGLSTSKD